MRGSLAFLMLALVAAATVVPSVAADHPGSTHGLVRYTAAGAENLVHRLPDVETKFAAWEAEYPDQVERISIGVTSTGFPLLGIRVTDESVAPDAADVATGKKLVVYLDGGHHGNEFLGVDLVMYYLEDLLAKAASGDEWTLDFLAKTEVYALPILNVDGNTLDTRKNGRQVDPNRNYDFQWGGPGSGSMITDLNYRGPTAFSEPEVKANADFAASIMPDLWITMHTGVAEFYWPWGWTHDPSPDDAFFVTLEAPFEEATKGRVDAMQAAELYLAAGATDDYGYATLGVPTFTFEVHEDQFVPLYGDPVPDIIADQLAGLRFMTDNVRQLGGWLEATATAAGLRLANDGWGAAWNVTVRMGGESMFIDTLAPGASTVLAIPAGATMADVQYQMLRIETGKLRQVEVGLSDVAPAADEEVTPPAPMLAGVALLALALFAMRRRGD